mmetsp:Transcript_30854/g.79976  ORF Transcript_30854/g.79976 Transcript_30854/m.79976 type:complete len:128 (+) Transcript_30854:326-709(+)
MPENTGTGATDAVSAASLLQRAQGDFEAGHGFLDRASKLRQKQVDEFVSAHPLANEPRDPQAWETARGMEKEDKKLLALVASAVEDAKSRHSGVKAAAPLANAPVQSFLQDDESSLVAFVNGNTVFP